MARRGSYEECRKGEKCLIVCGPGLCIVGKVLLHQSEPYHIGQSTVLAGHDWQRNKSYVKHCNSSWSNLRRQPGVMV